jgi:hypothetical protein
MLLSQMLWRRQYLTRYQTELLSNFVVMSIVTKAFPYHLVLIKRDLGLTKSKEQVHNPELPQAYKVNHTSKDTTPSM